MSSYSTSNKEIKEMFLMIKSRMVDSNELSKFIIHAEDFVLKFLNDQKIHVASVHLIEDSIKEFQEMELIKVFSSIMKQILKNFVRKDSNTWIGAFAPTLSLKNRLRFDIDAYIKEDNQTIPNFEDRLRRFVLFKSTREQKANIIKLLYQNAVMEN